MACIQLIAFRAIFWYHDTMLTESQIRYLETIPEAFLASVKPWDAKAAETAKKLIKKINTLTGLEVFWSGALALGISGQNDIDLSILTNPKNFEKYLDRLISILGEPTKKGKENILWRITKSGYRIDAYLGDQNSESIKLHKKIFELLNNDKNLLKEYELLKEEANGLSMKEYQKRKYEFYNRILA